MLIYHTFPNQKPLFILAISSLNMFDTFPTSPKTAQVFP